MWIYGNNMGHGPKQDKGGGEVLPLSEQSALMKGNGRLLPGKALDLY